MLRVWSKNKGAYLDKDGFMVDHEYNVYTFDSMDGSWIMKDDYYIVERNTGLLDMYDQELWEGDVVCLQLYHPNIQTGEYEVIYKDGRYTLDDIPDTAYIFLNPNNGSNSRVVKLRNKHEKSTL